VLTEWVRVDIAVDGASLFISKLCADHVIIFDSSAAHWACFRGPYAMPAPAA